MNRAAPPLSVTPAQRSTLTALTVSTLAPPRQVVRARALLLAAEGVANDRIAANLGLSATTVRSWRTRFADDGLSQLGRVRPGQGAKPTIATHTVEAIVRATVHSRPKGQAHWSCQAMADEFGVSAATVYRIWRSRGLKPHLMKGGRPSHTPPADDKPTDVVGLYLSSTEQALAVCMDEASRAHALDRIRLAQRRNSDGSMTTTQDGQLNSSTTMFAALDVMAGSVIGSIPPRRQHGEFVKFLAALDRQVPRGLTVHLVLDNYSTHQHRDVQNWLDRHPRFQLLFAPGASSWLNLAEGWFRDLAVHAPRGSFNSVPALIAAMETYSAAGRTRTPFAWTATTSSILERVSGDPAPLQHAVGQ